MMDKTATPQGQGAGSTSPTTQTAAAASTMGAPPADDVDRNHFPTRLHIMISTLENDTDGLNNVVTWQPHGRVFMIRDTELFIEKVLPKWFCRLKFTSFQRQLCLYGFRKLSKKGPDQGGYYHLSFIRDRLDLAATIEPGKIKGKRGRRPKSDESEPDFYKMDSLVEGRQPVEEAKLASPTSRSSVRPGTAAAAATGIRRGIEETKADRERLERAAQLDFMFATGVAKEDSPEQMTLETLLQQPTYQEELILENRQTQLHPPDLAAPTAVGQEAPHWPSIPTDLQQTLTEESHPISYTQTLAPAPGPDALGMYQQELSALPHNITNTAPASANTMHAAMARLTASPAPGPAVTATEARRMSDFSVTDVAPTWGWDSFSAAAEETTATGAAVASILEQAQAHAPPSITGLSSAGLLSGSGYAHQQAQDIQAQTEQQLQRILQEQRLKDLMDLNQKQQNNLRIQQEQLEQQRLELQMRDQEQLEQLRMELRAREEQQRRELQLQQQQRQQQQHQQGARLLVEPLPRPPPLFKPQGQSQRVAGRPSALGQIRMPQLPAQRQPPQAPSNPTSPRHQNQQGSGSSNSRQGPYQQRRSF